MAKQTDSSHDDVNRGDADLVKIFESVMESIASSPMSPLFSVPPQPEPAHLNILVELETIGRIQVDMRLGDSAPSANKLTPLTSKADRVKKAKDLLKANATYPKGCSEFVCAVLGIAYQQANDLMGENPTSVGSGPAYPDLEPGDIAGWVNTTGSGHVAVYIGEGGSNVFIDVREPGAKPRSKNGFYDHEMFKAPF